jgi:hypothetical protein
MLRKHGSRGLGGIGSFFAVTNAIYRRDQHSVFVTSHQMAIT